MDYKELIAQLRRFSAYYPVTGPIEGKAADAIETLLAERDAAMKYIPKTCYTCAHWVDGDCSFSLEKLLEQFGGCDYKVRQAWLWRGPQKERGA